MPKLVPDGGSGVSSINQAIVSLGFLTGSLIRNGKRTEWSPIRSVIISKFITSMITDRIGQHEVLLLINHKNYNFREKKNIKV